MNNWEQITLNDISTISSGKSVKYEKELNLTYPVLGSNGQIGTLNDYNFEKGYLLGRVGAAGSVQKITSKVWASDNTLTIKLYDGKTDFNFMEYLLKYLDYGKYATKTAQPLITQSILKQVKFSLPPLKEQQKIAEILSSVDAAIEKTEQVIAKTEEVKKGLMQQLLTKGIGHTEFKQTEVGEIPVEWEVKSGEELFNIVSGYSPSAVTDLIEAGSILFLKVNDFNNNRMYIKQSALYFEEANNSKIKCYNPGTIIFPKRGAAIFTNKIAILSKKAAFDTNIMGLECNHLINNQFLYFYLKNYGLYNISDNSGVPQLNNKHINPLLIPVPSLNEQIKIVENIQCFEMKLEKELLYLEKLFKVKQGLMQQLLTGQVRVKID
ncbi:MAG: restriction endonuclease subunit S [Turicibacter sp.]|nr:restriction endonuclease subunit S [Turicibacter sp.]